MRMLFIGGTGFISAAVSRQAIAKGLDLHLLNRGLRGAAPPGSHSLIADIHRPQDVRAASRRCTRDGSDSQFLYRPASVMRVRSICEQ